MFGVFDGFSKKNTIIAHKSSTSPNLDSRCSSVTVDQIDPNHDNDDNVDIQSIQITRDITELAEVSIEDTIDFVPNIQYGKVLQVYSGSEFLIASRIYNGYTKVLRPRLYKFRIKLRGIATYSMPCGDDAMYKKLTSMILDKIVILYQLALDVDNSNNHTCCCCLNGEVYLGSLHINAIMNTGEELKNI